MSLAAALSSVNGALVIAKGLRALEKSFDQAVLRAQLVELMEKVTDAKIELIEAQEAATAQDAEIARLTEAAAARSTLLDGPGGYRWKDKGDGLKRGYPICPTCDEKEVRQVELKQASRDIYQTVCPRCTSAFLPVEFFLDPTPDGKERTTTEARRQAAEQDARDSGPTGDYPWMR